MAIKINEPIAFVSDIHANLEALTAVLSDIQIRGVKKISCLGDIIGYGPDPIACMDIAMSFYTNLAGNHEAGVSLAAFTETSSPVAKMSMSWTREQIKAHPNAKRYWDFIRMLPGHVESESAGRRIDMYHGSPLDPLFDYVRHDNSLYEFLMLRLPKDLVGDSVVFLDIQFRDIRRALFKAIEDVCFVGNTHVAGVLEEGQEWLFPKREIDEFKLGKRKCYINPGSVGQPRDGNPKAAYAVLDGSRVTFYRVGYDVKKTHDKVMRSNIYGDMALLLVDRLLTGR